MFTVSETSGSLRTLGILRENQDIGRFPLQELRWDHFDQWQFAVKHLRTPARKGRLPPGTSPLRSQQHGHATVSDIGFRVQALLTYRTHHHAGQVTRAYVQNPPPQSTCSNLPVRRCFVYFSRLGTSDVL